MTLVYAVFGFPIFTHVYTWVESTMRFSPNLVHAKYNFVIVKVRLRIYKKIFLLLVYDTLCVF